MISALPGSAWSERIGPARGGKTSPPAGTNRSNWAPSKRTRPVAVPNHMNPSSVCATAWMSDGAPSRCVHVEWCSCARLRSRSTAQAVAAAMLWAMTHAKAAAWRQRSDPLEEQIRTNAPYRDSAADYRVFAMARCSTMVACGTSPKGESLGRSGWLSQIRRCLKTPSSTRPAAACLVSLQRRVLYRGIASALNLSANKEPSMHLENLHPRDNPLRLLSRRSFLARSVAAASPFLFASSTHAKETTMITDNEAVAVTRATSIRPFSYRATDEELNDLRRRVASTRFPDKEPVSDFSQGVKLATVQKLARYWATEYDWRKVEARMNSLPHFITEIDGLDIHFIHARSKHANALPIIVTHGWPGSIIEQLKIVDPLVNPTAHGGTATDAFHVVIPSVPGYGFSGKPTEAGWGPDRIARAWAVLMKRLGYTKYVAQGGDWGAVITDVMATQGHPELIVM